MKYLEYTFTLTPPSGDFLDVLEAVLADIGFESFVKDTDATVSPADAAGSTGDVVFTGRSAVADTASGEEAEGGGGGGSTLRAYIRAEERDEAALRGALEAFPVPGVGISYTCAEAEDRDWNAEWERNYFAPLTVDGRCTVSATFHRDVPRTEYNISINPRMSFGTGHHETTRQMLHELLGADLAGRSVLDMGCGTGILGILAAMRGAASVTAIDVDEWCVENARENFALNGVDGAEVRLGDAALLPRTETYDAVLANIHLNIITRDLPAYAACLRRGGLFLTSGFYEADLPRIEAAAAAAGLSFLHSSARNGWCCAAFRKA
ncbi:MAG: 50S ribosomal protein L11 methyltransferase [Alloprevotella sp.]|nr:50S ribosomal protein L11 methyltransferase [Alloprevotella sp.]